VAAAVYDAWTTWLLHPGMAQDTASIVKVQIMGTLLRQAEFSGRPLTQGRAPRLSRTDKVNVARRGPA